MTRDRLIQALILEGIGCENFPLESESYTVKAQLKHSGSGFITFLHEGIVIMQLDCSSYFIRYDNIRSLDILKRITSTTFEQEISFNNGSTRDDIYFEEIDLNELNFEDLKPGVIKYSFGGKTVYILYLATSKYIEDMILNFMGAFYTLGSLVNYWKEKVKNNELRY